MKTNGKKMLKITVVGLRNIALKLAFVIASIAATWLYRCDIRFICAAKVGFNIKVKRIQKEYGLALCHKVGGCLIVAGTP